MTGTVTAETEGTICTITLENEGKRNAFDYAMMAALIEEFDRLSEAGDHFVVVLRGAGEKAFSAGFDLTVDRTDEAVREEAPDRSLGDVIQHYEYPTIAMINGHVYGGAVNLIAACDFRIGVADATLGIPPATLGLVYTGDAIERIQQIIGSAPTKELLLTGEPISADRAHEIGFFNHVVERGDLEERTYELAETLAGNAPLSLIYMKRIINLIDSKAQLSEVEHDWIERIRNDMFETYDHREGVAAFNEGRAPEFRGE